MTDHNDTERPPAPQHLRFVGEVGPLFEALAKAQAEFKTIVADSTATVEGKEGKRGYTFDYAGLDVVLAAVRPALTKHGLSFCQVFSGLGEELHTILAFGPARLEVTCGLPEWKGAQGLGSAVTYMKRYQLLGMLGVAPSEDDDGNAADGNTANVQQRAKANPPPVQPTAKAAITPEARSTISGLAKELGWKNSDLEGFSLERGCGKLAELNDAKAAVLIKLLESAVEANKPVAVSS